MTISLRWARLIEPTSRRKVAAYKINRNWNGIPEVEEAVTVLTDAETEM